MPDPCSAGIESRLSAHRAAALGHSATLIGRLDAAVRDLSLRATLDTVTFKNHGEASSFGVGWM